MSRTIRKRANLAHHHASLRPVPVPFLGLTWQRRGPAYWWRRIGAAALMLLALAFVAALAVGFGVGLGHLTHGWPRVVLVALYCLTSLLGVRTGLRIVAAAPDQVVRPSPLVGVVFLSGPYATGVILVVFLAMLGREFLGERRARELSQPTS